MMLPVKARLWNHNDLWNGNYGMTDFLDILPVAIDLEKGRMRLDAILEGFTNGQ